MAVVPLADFAPDSAVYDSQLTAAGSNALRVPGGYAPQKGFVEGSLVALGAVCRGSIVIDYEGLTRQFAAVSNNLYEYDFTNDEWDSVKGALTIGLADGVTVDFFRLGDWLLACDSENKLMAFDLTDGTSPVFVEVADAPAGLIKVRSHNDLIVGIYNDGDLGVAAWSDTDDHTNWSTGLAGEQPLPGLSSVTGMAVGDRWLVFQKSKIHRFTYTSDATLIFTREEVDVGRGALGPDVVRVSGNRVFFVGVDGFYYCDWSGQVFPIGQDKVNQFFLDRCNALDRPYGLVSAIPETEVVWFSYVTTAEDGVTYNEHLPYDYGIDKWSPPTILSLQYVFTSASSGISLEDIGTSHGSLEEYGLPLDSRANEGTDGILAAFNSENEYGTLDGANLEATLRTAPYLEPQGKRFKLGSVFPIGNGMPENFTISVGIRERLNADPTWSSETEPETVTGAAMFHVSGRSAEFEIVIQAAEEWSRIEKIDVKPRAEGVR
jgi:hypothetical protein